MRGQNRAGASRYRGRHFSGKELVDLTLSVAAINAWNRLAVSFRPRAGSYRSKLAPAAAAAPAAATTPA